MRKIINFFRRIFTKEIVYKNPGDFLCGPGNYNYGMDTPDKLEQRRKELIKKLKNDINFPKFKNLKNERDKN